MLAILTVSLLHFVWLLSVWFAPVAHGGAFFFLTFLSLLILPIGWSLAFGLGMTLKAATKAGNQSELFRWLTGLSSTVRDQGVLALEKHPPPPGSDELRPWILNFLKKLQSAEPLENVRSWIESESFRFVQAKKIEVRGWEQAEHIAKKVGVSMVIFLSATRGIEVFPGALVDFIQKILIEVLPAVSLSYLVHSLIFGRVQLHLTSEPERFALRVQMIKHAMNGIADGESPDVLQEHLEAFLPVKY